MMSLTCAVRQVGIWVTGRYTGQRGVPRGAGLGDESHLRRQTGGYLGNWPIYGAAGERREQGDVFLSAAMKHLECLINFFFCDAFQGQASCIISL